MFKLNSKTALITGAASGIGEAIANTLSAAGARVIVADFNRRDGERVAQACATNGQGAHFLSLDVTDERHCVGVADTVRKEYGAARYFDQQRGHRPRWNNRSNRRN